MQLSVLPVFGIVSQTKNLMANSDTDGWRDEIKRHGIRALLAAWKAFCLAIAVVIHKGLDVLVIWLVPTGWETASDLLRMYFFVVFAVIYIHFGWEVLATFVPNIGRARLNSKKPEESRKEPDNGIAGVATTD